MHLAHCIDVYVRTCETVSVHMCQHIGVCEAGLATKRQEETVCRATSNLEIIKDPHFTSSLSPSPCFPPALTEPKQTIRGDYYEEEKRKRLSKQIS